MQDELCRRVGGGVCISRVAKSIFSFSLVFIMGGLGLLLAPQFVLSFLGFSLSEFLFPRLLGMTMLVLAYYYIRAAWNGLTEFFKWTVHARHLGVACYIVFVLFGMLPSPCFGLHSWTFLVHYGLNGRLALIE